MKTDESLMNFVRFIASFQTHSEAYAECEAAEKDIVWLQNDSADLERLVLDARKLLKEHNQ